MKLNKKQKRTATIASMAALLAVVLGMGGQTFAKYVTTATQATQTATVAKWGYVIKANASQEFNAQKAFSESYGTNSAIVSSSVGNAVVAPGATGSLSVYVKGKAEVKAKVTFTFVSTADVHYGADYYPIVWTISGTYDNADGTDATITGSEYTNLKASEIDGKLNAFEKTYDANADVLTTITLTWSWPFVGDDVKDTALGNMAVNGVESGSSISVGYTFDASVEQVEATY